MLQAYALQEFLKNNGHQVEIIDYRPAYLVDQYRVVDSSTSLVSRILRLPAQPMRLLRHNRFNDFLTSRLNLSQTNWDNASIEGNYDAYVLGSDQIWNSKITKGDLTFFGKFGRPKKSKLISYAASTEVSHEGDYVDFSNVKNYLREFSSIGVREEVLRGLIQPLVDTVVSTVLDPALLVDLEVFGNIASARNTTEYMLVYQVNTYANTVPIAKSIQARMNLKRLIKLVPRVSRSEIFNPYAAASPEKFVGLFKGAGYVVTTTFHGTVFAIIFKKQFVCVMSKTRGNYRISSLLNKLGLEDRMVYSINDIPDRPIDYVAVSAKLDVLREESRNFLIKALDFSSQVEPL